MAPYEEDFSEDVDQRKPSILREPHKKSITILLVGETGFGKTSFMELIINLFRGNGLFELEEVHNADGESGLSKKESQTTKSNMYTITTREGATIRLLDTPRLADTRGIEQDNKHKANINKAIQEHIETLDAVIILANGSVERLAAATDYTLRVITTMFPHSILDNIGFVFTNSDDLSLNFQVDSLPEELRQSKRWLIQNPLAMLKDYRAASAVMDDHTRVRKMKRQLQNYYDDSVETLTGWMDWLDERKVQPTHEIDRLYRISSNIEAQLEATLTFLTNLSTQRTEYQNLIAKLENNKHAKEALEEFVEQETSPVWDRQGSDEVNTICIAGGCFSNCHAPCRLEFHDSASELGRHCQAFGGLWTLLTQDGSTLECEVCGHKAKDHRHYNHINVLKNREMNPSTKQKLETATSEQERL
ncbi:AIG1 domain-containing protein [Ceratobasidium sp. AG-Ba]|nr:AIG1 domain-containing protein [Ceratobasidium sp. AG-Ba]QRW10296.1 AIG1 domain-containing protein [Ceratobasidium sp. AG-Ba]